MISNIFRIDEIGKDWLDGMIDSMIVSMPMPSPVEINEKYRYLPKSVAALHPGPMSYDKTPMLREIVNCADINSPIREITTLKGVQVAYTTGVLEAAAFYYMVHVCTLTMQYISADNEMAQDRVENNFIPMINESGFADIICSNDANSNKTGKTKKRLQWVGGGSLLPIGALNAAKMRSTSVSVSLKDELSGWPQLVGKDGDPDKLTDDRLRGQWDTRKIFRGSTPSEKPDKTEKRYKEGDQRKYFVKCKHCSRSQFLVWYGKDEESGYEWGFKWDYDKKKVLDTESVRYICSNEECKGEHYEHDKMKLFASESGAEWRPTAVPISNDIRSYHIPAYYSIFCPWHALVTDWIKCWDVESNKVKDIGLYQNFCNNVKAEAWEVIGNRIRYESVESHKRLAYKFGEVPNKFAIEHTDSKILFLTCQVDVQGKWLSVSIMGWTKGFQCFLIDYRNLDVEDNQPDSTYIESPVWDDLYEIITEAKFVADDGTKYNSFEATVIDARWGECYSAVLTFCDRFGGGVFPIMGDHASGKNIKKQEFTPFTTKAGTEGYNLNVNFYKERLAPVLRQQWVIGPQKQKMYHFNAPYDITRKQLLELTAETREKKVDPKGAVSYEWHRRGRNELWDLLVYGHALVEIICWDICVRQSELPASDWSKFWEYMELRLTESQA